MPPLPRAHGFRTSHAVVIGIGAYGGGFGALRNAADDARSVAAALARHGYRVVPLLDRAATRAAVVDAIAQLAAAAAEDDRAIIYFAGHGVALSSLDGDATGPVDPIPQGYVIPSDASAGEPASYLRMRDLHDALSGLACRHVLVILDCCFAGHFRWAASRDVVISAKLFQSQYERYVAHPAWQVLTSAASDEEALDFTIDRRGATEHSPFAEALLDVLDGRALPRTLVTASRLAVQLDEVFRERGLARQTPSLFLLPRHTKGQFVLQAPGDEVELEEPPPLDAAHNPYLGLNSYEEADAERYVGRAVVIEALVEHIESAPLTIVVAPSGAGKSSLVKAGVLPRLRARPATTIAPIVRLGSDPVQALRAALEAARQAGAGARIVVLIDQLEELSTMVTDDERRRAFARELHALAASSGDGLRVIGTLRADYESFVRARWPGPLPRFELPPLRTHELREIVERPAALEAVFFEDDLVDEIVSAVDGQPEALPLLSHLLRTLYASCATPDNVGRLLARAAYDALGGVSGSIARAAQQVHDQLVAEDAAYEGSIEHVMLRLVDNGPGPLASRRVLMQELRFAAAAEDARVARVLDRFIAARLLAVSEEGFVEPAHDALLHRWDRVRDWVDRARPIAPLQREVAAAAEAWSRQDRDETQLWDENGNLAALVEESATAQPWLNRTEAAFVAASEHVRVRRRRVRRRWWALGIAVGLAVIVVLIVMRGAAVREAERAEANVRLELARHASLAATSDARSCESLAMALVAALPRSGPPASIAVQALVDASAAAWCRRGRVGHTGPVRHVAVASRSERVVSTSDGEARVWDALTGRELGTITTVGAPGFAASSIAQDGSRVVTFHQRGPRRLAPVLWNAETGATIERLEGHSAPIAMVEMSPDGRRIATSDHAGAVRLWDGDGRLIDTFDGPEGADPQGPGATARFSTDGARLVLSRAGVVGELRDVASRALVRVFTDRRAIEQIAISGDGLSVVTVTFDALTFWSTSSDVQSSIAIGKAFAFAVSPDASVVAIGTQGGGVELFAMTGHRLARFVASDETLQAIACTRACARVLATDMYGVARVWDGLNGRLVATLPHRAAIARAAAIARDGAFAVTASPEGALAWSAHPGRTNQLVATSAPVVRAQLSPRGTHAAINSFDSGFRALEIGSQRSIAEDAAVGAAAFSIDESMLVSARGLTVRVWSTTTGAVERSTHLSAAASDSVVVSAGSERFAVIGHGRAFVFEGRGERPPWELAPVSRHIDRLRFSPSAGRALAVERHASGPLGPAGTRLLGLWELGAAPVRTREIAVREDEIAGGAEMLDEARVVVGGTHQLLVLDAAQDTRRTLLGQTGNVIALALSPARDRLVAASDDWTVRLWDPRRADLPVPIATLGASEGLVPLIRFAGDGARIAVIDRASVRVWRARDGAPIVSVRLEDVVDVAFSADGAHLIALRMAPPNRRIIVESIAIDPERLLRESCRHLLASPPDPTNAYDATARAACR